MAGGGILPFGTVFVELFFILTSLWMDQYYYVFGFLLLVWLLLITTCAEISIVLTYFVLCAEDYKWWWRSMLVPAASGCYLYAYCVHYFLVNLNMPGTVPQLLYFSYMGLVALVFSFVTGTAGYLASLGFLFFVGASIGAYAHKIRFITWVGIVSGLIVVVSLFAGGWKILGYAAMPYFLLWVATILPKRVQWIGQKNDYSYGIYLYGFLVQQTTAYFGLHKLGLELWIVLSMVTSFGLAWLSWKLIERPAINLKSIGPGRGFRFWWSKLTKG
jgi:peptidoglycan/LPS O-acetylase OafA/YrhL